MNKNMQLPFARYQIGKVYRDAPVRKGRYREFTQCDADIVGTDSLLADATCIQLALSIYKELGLDVVIKINNRKFLNALLLSYGIDEKKAPTVLTTLDKLEKIGRDAVLAELEEKGVAKRQELLDDVTREGTTEEKIEYFRNRQCDGAGIDELYELFSYLPQESVEFDPTIARGLGYYTGTVFEVIDATGGIDSSIGAGGRYDNLIDEYLKAAGIASNRKYPGVGFSFGLDRMVAVLQAMKKDKVTSPTQLLLVSMDTKELTMQVAMMLRRSGVATAVDMTGKKLSKVFAVADEQKIPFVGVIGENEKERNTITLKNLETGEQKELSVQEVITTVKQ
jgi:histidyl-tRNA synthetase